MHIAAGLLAVMALGALPALAAPTVAGCPVFPWNSHWNTRVDHLPLHSSSSTWVNSVGATAKLHPDWGNVLADYYGIPYVTVPGTQPTVPIEFGTEAGEESDPGPYPIPADAPIEGLPGATDGDRHVVVVETTNCRLYELYNAVRVSGGASWSAYSGARFDFASHALRPLGWTSADAAGLPIFPGLVRWEEVEAGEIAHAIRFTAVNIWATDASTGQRKYLWPARHWSGSSTNSARPPMGARFRLNASFDITPYDPRTQVILRAFKKYGLILADGGGNWFFQGVSDTRWPDVVFNQLKSIAGSNFEVVDTSFFRVSNDSGEAIPRAAVPTDLNADGRSDLLWRNDATGLVFRMLMNGFGANGAMVYHEPDLAWKIAGDGDFKGDGTSDLLYRSDATGQVSMVRLHYGGFFQAVDSVYTEPNMAWKIVHTPDLNGDGKSDLVWWNANTGQVYAMLMNGASIAAQGFVYHEPNTAWKIVASGDFAGSGKHNQLLWRNSTTGQVFLMTVGYSGGAFSQTGQLIYQEGNTAWKIVATNDFNGDGRSDILWRNESTGQVYLMLMNGHAILDAAFIYHEPDTAWKIAAVGDYDSDGKADLLWRNDSTGQVFMILMNGFAISSAGMIYHEPNLTWKLLGPSGYAQASGVSP